MKTEERWFPFSNQLMFSLVMRDKNRCRAFLERIFPDKRIKEIHLYDEKEILKETDSVTESTEEFKADFSVETEQTILNREFGKSVRLDVLFEGNDSWFDFELQADNRDDLAKRSRYYHGMIDTKLHRRGQYYSELRPCYVIFLCCFDLFGQDEPVYEFEYYDVKKSLRLGDESYTIFLNSKSKKKDISPGLKALFDYVNGGIPKPGKDALVDDIHREVIKCNHDKEAMKTMTIEEEIRNREYMARKKALIEGEQRYNMLVKKLLAAGRTDDLARSTEDEEFRRELYKEFIL